MILYQSRKEDVRYAFAVGKIRAVEARFLDAIFFRRLIEVKDSREMANIFGETVYGNLSKKESTDFESLLAAELQRTYQLIRSIDPDPSSVTNLLAMRYDFHNLKILLKLRRSIARAGFAGADSAGMGSVKTDSVKTDSVGTDSLLIPVGYYGPQAVRQMVNSADYSPFPPEVALEIRSLAAGLEKPAMPGQNLSPQQIDIALDHSLYRYSLRTAEGKKNRFMATILRVKIDFINIRTMLRVKQMEKERSFLSSVLLEGGEIPKETLLSLLEEPRSRLISSVSFTPYAQVVKEGVEYYREKNSLALFEKLADNFLIRYIGQAKYITFGVEPLISFIIAKENEIKNLRIVTVGKQNKLSDEAIEERLRDIYG